MSEIPELLILLLAALGALNLAVSFPLLTSPFYSTEQKAVQLAVVWLLPVVGAVLILSFLRAQFKWKKQDTRTYPEPSEKMVLTELDNSAHD